MSEDVNEYQGIPNQWSGTPITDHTFTGIPPTISLKSAYIPTVFTAPPELKVGEKWYVKFPDSTCLSEARILDVTEKTVLFYSNVRFKKTDVEFVEKVQE